MICCFWFYSTLPNKNFTVISLFTSYFDLDEAESLLSSNFGSVESTDVLDVLLCSVLLLFNDGFEFLFDSSFLGLFRNLHCLTVHNF